MRIIDAKLTYTIGCLAAVLIFFQANFIFDRFQINLNLADVLSICAISITLLHWHYNDALSFRSSHIKLFMYGSIAAFALAFAVGWYNYGFNKLAFLSKLLGFFILLGYASIGALFVRSSGVKGLKIITNIMTSVLLTIVIFELIKNLLCVSGIIYTVGDLSLAGYSNNRNAFAMQIMGVLCLRIALNNKNYSWIESFMLFALALTYSKSAILAMICLSLMLVVFKFITIKQLIKLVLQTSMLLVTFLLLEHIFCQIVEILRQSMHFEYIRIGLRTFAVQNFSKTYSNQERIYTLMEGLKLWLKNPFFGIGLGSFANHSFASNNAYLVIHNSFLWLLTEFGIVGASVFFWYGFLLSKHVYTLLKSKATNTWHFQDRLLFCLIIIFAVMANIHEMFYQRIVWFLIGIALVSYKRANMPLQGMVKHNNV